MRILIVTAVDREAHAIDFIEGVSLVVGGIGRTNAAAATTEALLKRGPFDAVISAGVAGALPESSLTIGQTLVASACIYSEEGLVSSAGLCDMTALGLSLGDFEGNVVPVDDLLLEKLAECFRIGPIATVAICSGTDEAARSVVRRTGALAEAMEGAAVVHAARRLHTPAIELRTISNSTGDRVSQTWDLDQALAELGQAVRAAVRCLGGPVP